MGAGSILLGLAFAIATPAAAADLVISNWDGYMAPDAVDAFKAATGVSAEVVVHATNEEIMGKLVASGGKGYDVVFVSSPFAEVLNKLGLTEPIDHAKVPNLANLYPEATTLPYDPGNTFSVPYTWGTTGLCYRSDLVKTAPTSWNDLLAPSDDLKGKTTMLATDRWLLAAGFLAKGYSVNETDPAKLAEVKDALIAAKKTLLAYDDTTFYSKLVSGEALMVQAWDGWCNYGIAENAGHQIRHPEGRLGPLARHHGRHEVVGAQGRGVPVHELHARRQEPRLGGAEHRLQGAEQAGDGKPAGRLPGQVPEHRDAGGRAGEVRAAARRRRRPARIFEGGERDQGGAVGSLDRVLTHPPLSCRTSPPQGGRSAVIPLSPISASQDQGRQAAVQSPPFRGDVRPFDEAQDEGGAAA